MTPWQDQTIQQFRDLYFERCDTLCNSASGTDFQTGLDTLLTASVNIIAGILGFLPLDARRETIEVICARIMERAEEAGGQLGGIEIILQQTRSPQ